MAPCDVASNIRQALGGGFLVGDAPTIADCAMIPMLAMIPTLETIPKDCFEVFPEVVAYMQRFMAWTAHSGSLLFSRRS